MAAALLETGSYTSESEILIGPRFRMVIVLLVLDKSVLHKTRSRFCYPRFR